MVQQTKEQRRQAEAVAARGRRCEAWANEMVHGKSGELLASALQRATSKAAVLRDAGNLNKRLADFVAMTPARVAELTWSEVAALRLYTSSTFRLINGPLREAWGEQPHPFPVTISFLTEAIGRLRAVEASKPEAHVELDLWRGMKDVAASDVFMERGGTELAPMSTTAALQVAVQYSQAATSLLFKLRTDTFMGRGVA